MRAMASASAAGSGPPPPALEFALAVPLLASTASSGPRGALDFGVRCGPRWPVTREEQTTGWQMANARGRAPWFCVSPLSCVLPASASLHPFMLPLGESALDGPPPSKRANRGLALRVPRKAPRKRAAAASSSAAAASASATAAASAVPVAAADAELMVDDDEILEAEIGAVSATLADNFGDLAALGFDPEALTALPPDSAAHPLSIDNQLGYFARVLGGKRLRSAEDAGGVSAFPLLDRASRGGVVAATAGEFERECANAVPRDLLRQILQEDAQLAEQESQEDLLASRLAIIHQGERSFALLPTGALMEELAVAPIQFAASSSLARHNSAGQLSFSVAIAHSLAIDSTIRQICLTTPPPPPVPSADSAPHALPRVLPLIISRSCYQLHVHTLVFPPADVSAAASSSSVASAPTPTLSLLDSHSFRSPIAHVACNHAIANELAVLLQDGSLWLWNVHADYTDLWTAQFDPPALAQPLKARRKLTHFPPASYAQNVPFLATPLRWARLAFAPTPRTLRVFLPHAVLQVDLRAPYAPPVRGQPCPPRGRLLGLPQLVLDPAHMFSAAALREIAPQPLPDGRARLYAASTNPRNPFQHVLVSADFVLLCDVRQGSGATPLLQWAHHQAGEPPSHIEWLDFKHADSAGCADCTDQDSFFLTHNRQRNEVTLYHYSLSPISSSSGSSRLHGHSTAFSSFSPLRLQSLLHADQQHRALGTTQQIVAEASHVVNPLVGVQLVRAPGTANVWHLLQLSEYGALVSQAFQHRHDPSSQATHATIVPLVDATAVKDIKPSLRLDTLVSPQRPSSAPAPSLSPSAHSPLGGSGSGTEDLPPWMMPHELKPFRAVNLKGLLEACAENLAPAASSSPTPGGDLVRASRKRAAHDSAVPSFSHLLAAFHNCFNAAASAIYTFLALPKTLHEIASFVVEANVLDDHTKHMLAQCDLHLPGSADAESSSQPRRTRQSQQAAASSAPKQLSARDLHTVAQLVSATLHAFVFAFDPQQAHPPYHMDRWKQQHLTCAPDSDSQEELDPYAEGFSQPTFALYHYHLSLARFAEQRAEAAITFKSREDSDEDESSEAEERKVSTPKPSSSPSPPAISTCKCASISNAASANATSCCCLPLCASAHCLLLHSSVYASSPSLLHLPWPAPAVRGLSYDAEDDVMVSLQPFQAGFNHTTPHRAPKVADLSQDIGFLMSQSQDTQALSQENFSPIDEGDEGERLIDDDSSPAYGLSPLPAPRFSPDADGDGDLDMDRPPAPAPADPHALQDMLAGMGDTWQQAQRLCEQLVAASAAGSAHDDDAAAELVAMEQELATANADAFMRGLISHDLAMDPTAARQAANGAFGEDLRGSLLDEMEDRAGNDGDD